MSSGIMLQVSFIGELYIQILTITLLEFKIQLSYLKSKRRQGTENSCVCSQLVYSSLGIAKVGMVNRDHVRNTLAVTVLPCTHIYSMISRIMDAIRNDRFGSRDGNILCYAQYISVDVTIQQGSWTCQRLRIQCGALTCNRWDHTELERLKPPRKEYATTSF